MPGFYLELNKSLTNMIQNTNGQFLTLQTCDIIFIIREVSDHLVHSINSNRGEMVFESSKVPFSKRIESAFHQPGHNLTFGFKTVLGGFQKVIQVRN